MHEMSTSKLLLMAGIHFVIMYLVMYTMIDSFDSFYNNLNQAYMAGMMTAPMLLLEVIFMGGMYRNRRALWSIALASVAVFVVLFIFMRQQTAIGDTQFLRSMIPHHSGAILMCNESTISDPEIARLCDSIVASQRAEIDQMKRILGRLE